MSLYDYEFNFIKRLKEKYNEWENKWDYDDSQDPNILIAPEKDVAIEWADNGMYKISKMDLNVEIEYTDFREGHTFGIYQGYDMDSWQKYRELYIRSKTNAFRIDVPISVDKIDFKGEEWEYHHLMRPDNSLGFANFHHFDPEKLNLSTHLNQLKDSYYQVLLSAKEIAAEYGNDDLPAILVGNVLRDHLGFYFIRPGRRWNQKIDRLVDDSVHAVPFLFKYALHLDDAIYQEWKTDAISKWESLK
jgi:hypothetical protein